MGVLSTENLPWNDYPDTTMGQANKMLDHPSGTFLEARKRIMHNKKLEKSSFDLTEEQESQKGKIQLYSVIAGLFAKNPGVGLLNAVGATDQYENQQKYNNYLDNRLKMHGLSKQEEAGLRARRYAGESFASTSPSTAASRAGTWSKQWLPGNVEGREQAYGMLSTTNELERLIGPDGQPIPDRERQEPYQLGGTEVRNRANQKAQIDGARDRWRAMPESQRKLLKARFLKGGIRDTSAREFLNLILGEYEGMDPADKREIEAYLFGDDEAKAAKAANRARTTDAELGPRVDALDALLEIPKDG